MPLPVFLISDIPDTTLKKFVDATTAYARDIARRASRPVNEIDLGMFRLVTSKDPSDLGNKATRTTLPFRSPFLGETAQEVADWYKPSIGRQKGFNSYSFIVLDAQTAKDNYSCIVAGLSNEYEPIQIMRCDFLTSLVQAPAHGYGSRGFDDGVRGLFMRSKIIMTNDNSMLALSHILGVVNGVFRLKEGDELLTTDVEEYESTDTRN